MKLINCTYLINHKYDHIENYFLTFLLLHSLLFLFFTNLRERQIVDSFHKHDHFIFITRGIKICIKVSVTHENAKSILPSRETHLKMIVSF